MLSFLPAAKIRNRIASTIGNLGYRNLELLSSCLILGNNNVGKTNLLLAIFALKFLVTNSHNFTLGDSLEPNESFQFDLNKRSEPTTFEIEFLAKNGLRYHYRIVFTRERMLEEELSYFPNPDSQRIKRTKLFYRTAQSFSYGEALKGEKKLTETRLLQNQLFLSRAVQDNLEQLNPIYEFFTNHINTSVFHDAEYENLKLRELGKFIYENEEQHVKDLMETFLINSDAGIVGLQVSSDDSVPKISFPDGFSDDERKRIEREWVKKFQYQIQTEHRQFDGDQEIGISLLPLKEQSTGTKKYLILLQKVLMALKSGDLLIVDELDKSLHSEWTKTLIDLFHDSDTNPNNAQLLFVTHDTNLLNFNMFSRDQIYLIEKDRFGASQVFPISDFTDVRASAPLEEWYLSGRFGAVPQIRTGLLKSALKESAIFSDGR